MGSRAGQEAVNLNVVSHDNGTAAIKELKIAFESPLVHTPTWNTLQPFHAIIAVQYTYINFTTIHSERFSRHNGGSGLVERVDVLWSTPNIYPRCCSCVFF